MSKIKLTGTELSSSLNSTGSFGRVDIGNADFSGNINMTGDGVHTINTANDVPLRVKSTDGTGAISIGDNSSGAETHNRIQVTGDVMELIAANSKRVELSSGAIVFNQDSDDVNFRIETNDNDNMVSIDGAKNHMSIGVSRGNHDSDEILVVAGNTGITGSLHVSGNITTSGSIIAKEFRTEFVNQIIATSSGSTTFGDGLDDVHRFTGSVNITGSLTIPTGSLDVRGGVGGTDIATFARNVGATADIGIHAGSGDPQMTFTTPSRNFSIGASAGGHEFRISEHTAIGTDNRLIVRDDGDVFISQSLDFRAEHAADKIVLYNGGSEKIGTSAHTMILTAASHSFKDTDGHENFKITPTGDLVMLATGKLRFDGSDAGHTYIHESAGDVLDFVVGGQQMLRLYEGGTDYVHVNDNTRLGVGSDPDLIIYHDGSNSSIENLTGNLYIDEHTNDGEMIFRCDDGSGGVTPYISLVGSTTTIDIAQHMDFADDVRARFGASGDLQIVHTGNTNYIHSAISDRDLHLRVNDGGSNINAITIDASEVGSVFMPNDNAVLGIGAGNDLRFWHDGTNSNIYNYVGELRIGNTTNDSDIILYADDQSGGNAEYVKLDGSAGDLLLTPPSGKISGSINSTGSFNSVAIPDGGKAIFGASEDIQIYHNGGGNSNIENHSGDLYVTQYTNDKDIIFRSDDGSGGVTPYLTLDGSTGMTKVTGGGALAINVTADQSLLFQRDGGSSFSIEHDTSQLYFYNRTQNKSTIMFKHAGPVIINEDSSPLVDFRIETDAQSHALFTNSSDNTVGIFAASSGLSGSLVVGGGSGTPGGIMISHQNKVGTSQPSTVEQFPVGHYTTGEEIFSIDQTWSDSNLSKYFGDNAKDDVYFTASSDAPGGYAIRIDGQVSVGGEYNSGFPYIPIREGDVYYMECWIQNVGDNQTHYMGSNEYNQNFASQGGNPGSYGYWVMSNTNTGTGQWIKQTGYISGSSISTTGTFETSSRYWTPMALFNYGAGSGTRSCVISGWKVVKMNNSGNQIFDNILVSGSIALGNKSNTNVTGGLGLDASGSAKDSIPWHGRTRIGSPESIGASPAQAFGIKTPHGHVLHGPQNSSWNHIITDRAGNYFNSKVTVDSGIVESYDENLQLRRYQSANNMILVGDGRQEFTMESRAVLNMNASTTTAHAGLSGSLRVSGSDGLSSVMTNRGVDGVPAYSFIGDEDTGMLSPGVNNIALSTAGTRRYLIDASGNHSIYGNTSFSSPLSVNYGATINEGGNDSDTRIEGSSDANLFRVDAGNNRVGIGTGSPGNKFTVDDTGASQVSIQYDASTRLRISIEDSGRARFYTDNSANVGIESGGFYIQPTNKLFLDGGNDTYLQEESGNVVGFYTGGARRAQLSTTYFAVPDSAHLGAGNDVDILMRHNGTDSHIINSVGELHISQSAQDKDIEFSINDGGNIETPMRIEGSTGKIHIAQPTAFQFANDQRIFDDGGGGLKVGAESHKLQLFGGSTEQQVRVLFGGRNGSEKFRMSGSGDFHADGDVIAASTTISDKRLKDNVEIILRPLDKVKEIRGVSFDWNKGSRKGQRDIGLIAQEVEKVLPELVREKKMVLIDDKEYLTVDYDKMVAVLVEAVKEQQVQIEELKEDINELRGDK